MIGSQAKSLTFWGRVQSLPLILITLICVIVGIGATALYSAAGGDFNRWSSMHLIRFVPLFLMMLFIALTHLKWWYWAAYPLWILGILLLLIVEIMGHVGMGAQRWINLGFMNLQPSELMKVAVVMALARYYHDQTLTGLRTYKSLLWPLVIMGAPMGLVMMQPDLGTALMIGMAGASVLFMAGVRMRLFIGGVISTIAIVPLSYLYVLKGYQRKRVDTFLDPASDPMGAGYHITQSKIAIGSGGVDGKGFLEGTQSRLNFLPEKQTDFIFTLWAEEWGMIGCLGILTLYIATFVFGFIYAMQAKHMFAKLIVLGLTMNLSLYVIINTGMVMGLMPVVGVPLPLISYGGSAMLAALICYGLIMSAKVFRGQPLPRGDI
ncbi:MAG: rod shape-determining protein RodA [Alphaproteobacteria bacterium]|nr:MAG: rod shape-determining protein RodA [Alphaproteobacteria bacterium]